MKKKKGVIILASAQSKGDTFILVEELNKSLKFPVIDLKGKNIGHFDYEFKNQEDDFMPLLKSIVKNYDLILFATPVYWYSMSGHLKVFFDRISDALKIEKEVGRKLKGKGMAVLSCGYDKELKNGFHMPFKASANYLGMNYVGDVHGWLRKEKISDRVIKKLQEFADFLI